MTTADPTTLPAMWRAPLQAFEITRQKYLIYQ
jgi:hypothetical protein